MTLQNEKFEELITQHLQATLDAQRGKALAAFRQHLAREDAAGNPTPTPRAWRQQEIPRRALWWWTGVPAAAAAGLAVAVMLQLGPRQGANPGAIATSGKTGGVVASSVEITQNQTGGIVVNDNKPMREVRQQIVKQKQWVDPQDHAVYTVTEPTVKVDYVQVQPN
jgi:hypothetical protein